MFISGVNPRKNIIGVLKGIVRLIEKKISLRDKNMNIFQAILPSIVCRAGHVPYDEQKRQLGLNMGF